MTRNVKGYTLIELTVVIVLVGLMISLTFPRFQYALLVDDFKAATQKLVRAIKDLRNEANWEHRIYFLRFDLESNRYWIEKEGMTEQERALSREQASSFPEGVRVLDIWFKEKGKQMAGEIAIRFNEKGYVRQSVIHLGSKDGRKFTIVLRPFLESVEIHEKYVEYESL